MAEEMLQCLSAMLGDPDVCRTSRAPECTSYLAVPCRTHCDLHSSKYSMYGMCLALVSMKV